MSFKISLSKLVSVAFCIACSAPVFGWGRTAHNAIAFIAEQEISERTKTGLSYYLGSGSIVQYAMWMDKMRKSPQHVGTLEGHSFAVDGNCDVLLTETPFSKDPSRRDDGLYGFISMMDSLKNGQYKTLPKSQVSRALKVIIHLVGDYHCPSHIRYPDSMVNRIIFNGRNIKYHSFWDSALIEYGHGWSFSEYAYVLDNISKREKYHLQEGDIVSWCEETAAICAPIHDWVSEGGVFDKYLIYSEALPLADMMIQRAGYRLAKVLDDIFRY